MRIPIKVYTEVTPANRLKRFILSKRMWIHTEQGKCYIIEVIR